VAALPQQVDDHVDATAVLAPHLPCADRQLFRDLFAGQRLNIAQEEHAIGTPSRRAQGDVAARPQGLDRLQQRAM